MLQSNPAAGLSFLFANYRKKLVFVYTKYTKLMSLIVQYTVYLEYDIICNLLLKKLAQVYREMKEHIRSPRFFAVVLLGTTFHLPSA
jgi:hypothetical protein